MKQTNKKKQHAISFNYGKKRASAKLYLRRYQSMVNNILEEPWCDMSSFSYLPSSHYRRGRSLQFTWCSQESCAHSNNKPTHELPISASNRGLPSQHARSCSYPKTPGQHFLLLNGASVFAPEVLFQCYQYELCSHADRQSITRYQCGIITRRRQPGEICTSWTPEVTDIKGKWIAVKTEKCLKIIKIWSNVI